MIGDRCGAGGGARLFREVSLWWNKNGRVVKE